MTTSLTCRDVADLLGVTRHCVAQWAIDGELAATKTSGGMWLFDPAVVAAFVPPSRRLQEQGCAVEGCTRPYHALGHCKPHYQRLYRTNDAKADVPIGHVRFGQYNRGQSRPTVDLIDTDEI